MCVVVKLLWRVAAGGRRAENGMPSRISSAEALVHMGEFSSARQALEGSALAPGSEATLNAVAGTVEASSGAARSDAQTFGTP